jgi:hypothetical protein
MRTRNLSSELDQCELEPQSLVTRSRSENHLRDDQIPPGPKHACSQPSMTIIPGNDHCGCVMLWG